MKTQSIPPDFLPITIDGVLGKDRCASHDVTDIPLGDLVVHVAEVGLDDRFLNAGLDEINPERMAKVVGPESAEIFRVDTLIEFLGPPSTKPILHLPAKVIIMVLNVAAQDRE